MLNFALALCTETPGLSRPTIARVLPQRLVSSVRGNGKYRSMRLPGAKTEPKSNEAGRTPTTVTGESSSRSEEHTSELQSPDHLVCRLLLGKNTARYALHCSDRIFARRSARPPPGAEPLPAPPHPRRCPPGGWPAGCPGPARADRARQAVRY